jgi:hypothetical protein
MITNNFDTSDIEVAHPKLDSVYVARPAVLKLNIQTVEKPIQGVLPASRARFCVYTENETRVLQG